MTHTAGEVAAALAAIANPGKASDLGRFFKTGPGEYGEGDVFLGLAVPTTRRLVRQFVDLPLGEVDILLDSEVHEHRFAGLLILVARFSSSRDAIAGFYLGAVRRGRVNNWDLVDCSAPQVLGAYLFDRPRGVLFELASSSSVWERRVAVISTLGFIMRGDSSTTLEIATLSYATEHLSPEQRIHYRSLRPAPPG